MYIDDLIKFVFKTFKQKSNFEIINCGLGKSYKIKDVLKKIIIISKTKKKIENILKSKNINVNILINIRKAKKLFNWQPKIKLDQGLRETIKWYKKNYEKIL